MGKGIVFTVFFFVLAYALYAGIKTSLTTLPDFTIFYHAAKDVLQHTYPYKDRHLFTAFNYPLVTSILFIPFTLFPLHTAQLLFSFLNILTVFSIAYFCFLLTKKRVTFISFFITVSFIFLSFPTKFTFGMGQVNLLALASLLGGFACYTKQKHIWSVLLIILAFFLKPILAVTLVVFLFEKQWKLFFTILVITILAFLLAPLFIGLPLANQLFFQTVSHQSFAGREVYYNQGLLGFISRLTTSLAFRALMDLFVNLGLLVTTTIYVIQKRLSLPQILSFVLTIIIILDPLSWQHHFIFLILPFFVVWFTIKHAKKQKLILYLLYAVSYLLISLNIKNPLPFTQFPLLLILSHTFYGAIILFILMVIVFAKKKPKAGKQHE